MSNQVVRQIPRLMMPRVVASTEGAVKTETAFTNDKDGVCPLCESPMRLSVANGVDVYVCLQHRVAMPLRNEGQ